MATNDPLLEHPQNHGLTQRRHSRSKNPPDPPPDPNQNHLSPSQNNLDSKLPFLVLSAYVLSGALSFYLVRHQIKGNKTNGLIDAVYFCIVTMTTVGYGDLVPDSIPSKLLACVFVFIGMGLVGVLLSNAADKIVENQEVVLAKAMHMRDKCSPGEILKEVETNRVKYKCMFLLGLLAALMGMGMVFLWRVEGLDLFDAFYCVCATITTLGYGDESFSTSGGRLFAAVWILVSTVCLAQTFYAVAEVYTERRRKAFVRWVLSRKLTVADIEAADLDHDSFVSASEFVVYKLKEMGKISDEDVATVMEWFEQLDVDRSGTLTKADLVNSGLYDNDRLK